MKFYLLVLALPIMTTAQSVSCSALRTAYKTVSLSTGETGCCGHSNGAIDASSCVASTSTVDDLTTRVDNLTPGTYSKTPSTMVLESDTTIAHRGGAPENTFKAIELSRAANIAAFEIDIVISADLTLFCSHPSALGLGYGEGYTYPYARRQDAASQSTEYAGKGWYFPTLREVFERYADTDMKWFLDVKDPVAQSLHMPGVQDFAPDAEVPAVRTKILHLLVDLIVEFNMQSKVALIGGSEDFKVAFRQDNRVDMVPTALTDSEMLQILIKGTTMAATAAAAAAAAPADAAAAFAAAQAAFADYMAYVQNTAGDGLSSRAVYASVPVKAFPLYASTTNAIAGFPVMQVNQSFVTQEMAQLAKFANRQIIYWPNVDAPLTPAVRADALTYAANVKNALGQVVGGGKVSFTIDPPFP